jgi:hypothetical protein
MKKREIISIMLLVVIVMVCITMLIVKKKADNKIIPFLSVDENIISTNDLIQMPTKTKTIVQNKNTQMATQTNTDEPKFTTLPTPICMPGGYQSISPTGEWLSDLCERETKDGPYYLFMLNTINGKTWRVDYDNEKYAYDGYLQPALWTNEYLYIIVNEQFDGWGTIYKTGNALLRLDLHTGDLQELLERSVYSLSISPSEKIAYIKEQSSYNQVLYILNGGSLKESTKFGDQYCAIGIHQWSPGEDRILLEGAVCEKNTNTISTYELIVVSIATENYEVVNTLTNRLNPLKCGTIIWSFLIQGYPIASVTR